MKLKYIEDLLAEAEAVSPEEIREVADTQAGIVPPSEDLVGVLPEDLRKLAVVMFRRGEELRKFVLAESSKPRTGDMVFEAKRLLDFDEKAEFLQYKLAALEAIFWEAVSVEFGIKEVGLAINGRWQLFFANHKCNSCGKRHSKEKADGKPEAIPGLDGLLNILGGPGVSFGRGGNA